jgi:hypothetical protein
MLFSITEFPYLITGGEMAYEREDQMKIGLSYQMDDPILALLTEVAEQYRRLRMTRTTVARIFVEERIALYQAGWKLNDDRFPELFKKIIREPHIADICESIIHLDEQGLERVIAALRNSGPKKGKTNDITNHRGA